MHCDGIDADLMTREEVAKLEPLLDMSCTARFPIKGGLIQRRGGTARHDAVAWGYARGADSLGVDIIQNCEVTGIAFTPDGKSLFISIQHPGETPSDRSDPKDPQKFSSWPDHQPNGRPRSATVVIRKRDGGVIGS